MFLKLFVAIWILMLNYIYTNKNENLKENLKEISNTNTKTVK